MIETNQTPLMEAEIEESLTALGWIRINIRDRHPQDERIRYVTGPDIPFLNTCIDIMPMDDGNPAIAGLVNISFRGAQGAGTADVLIALGNMMRDRVR